MRTHTHIPKLTLVNKTDATSVGNSSALLSLDAESTLSHVYSILINTVFFIFFLFYRPRFCILQKKGEND